MNKLISSVVSLALFAVGCVGAEDQAPTTMAQCGMYDFNYGVDYAVSATEVTPAGIPVDRSGQSVPRLETIDKVVGEVEACLRKNFDADGDDIGTLPDEYVATSYEEILAGKCRAKTFVLPIDRGCWQVKIPARNTAVTEDGSEDRGNSNGWMLSKNHDNEVLPSEAPAIACEKKGLTPTEEFECYWRAVLQGNTIVTTPSLFLLPDVLIRAVTGCGDSWSKPLLAECASPKTPALSSQQ